MNKALIKDALALTLITLVAGCLLGFVHKVTEKPIAEQEEKVKQEAYQTVFPEAKSFVAVEGMEDADAIAGHVKEAMKETDLAENNVINEIMAANALDANSSANPEIIGYVMTITNSEAYEGTLTLSMGITIDGTVTGIEFTDIGETAGLGMKATEAVFKDQFKDKKVEAFAYTKSGASADNEIDALSGATITTNSVTNAVNAGIAFYQYVTGGGSDE